MLHCTLLVNERVAFKTSAMKDRMTAGGAGGGELWLKKAADTEKFMLLYSTKPQNIVVSLHKFSLFPSFDCGGGKRTGKYCVNLNYRPNPALKKREIFFS